MGTERVLKKVVQGFCWPWVGQHFLSSIAKAFLTEVDDVMTSTSCLMTSTFMQARAPASPTSVKGITTNRVTAVN